MERILKLAYGAGKPVSSPVSLRQTTLVAYRALSDLVAKGSLFVITVAAARQLSQTAFGIFSLASTLGWILAIASDFGIELHVARVVARVPSDAQAILRTWLNVRLWTALSAFVLVAIGLVATPATDPYAIPILLFALVYIVGGLIEFLHYFYRGLDRTDVESSLTMWQRVSTLGLALAALAWRPRLTTLAVAMLVPVLITFAISVKYASGLQASGMGRLDSFLLRRRSATFSEFQHEVFPIGAGIVLSALYFRIDVFFIDLWKGAQAVGLYNAVFRLVEALRLFPAAVLAVALPALCRSRDARPLVHLSAAVTLFAIAVTVTLWLTAGWLVPFVYGSRYAAAVPAFRVLLLCFPLLSLNYALTHQLIGWDRQWAYAVICGIALLANVALNVRLVPTMSIEGAAWATLWTEVVITVGCAIGLGSTARSLTVLRGLS